MYSSSKIPKQKSELTLEQWIRRALKLPWTEIARRVSKLIIKTTKNYFMIRRILRQAGNEDRSVLFIILTERIGDIIAGHPAVAGLVRPSQDIVWLVREQYVKMLEFNPHVKHVLPVSSYTETILLRKIYNRADWKNLQTDGHLCSMFGTIVKNPNDSGLDQSNYYSLGTLTDVYSLIGLGHKTSARPEIFYDRNFAPQTYLHNFFAEPSQKFIAIHVSSDDADRSWPGEKSRDFAAFILAETKFNVVEFGLTPTLKQSDRVFLARNSLSLNQQVSLMAEATIFIGVDSGFSHIANALAIPSLLLLGKYRHFLEYKPWEIHEHDFILRSTEMAQTIKTSDVKIRFSEMIKDHQS